MKNYETDKIRNVGLFSHQSAGKTTLAEAMLYTAKAIDRQGRIEEGNTTTDFDPDEIERQISISLALAPCEWKDHKINCIDTPGFMDFIADVKSALRVAETAIMLVPANSGVEVGLEKVWEEADLAQIPRLVFINKMDKENADFNKVYEELKNTLSSKIAPVQLPIGSETNFKGIIDLVEGIAYTFDKGAPQKADIPDDLQSDFKKFREKLMETAAETNDDLLNKYLLEGQELTPAEIKEAIKVGMKTGKFIPLLCGSAYKNIGVSSLMDVIINNVSAPSEAGATKGINPKTKKEEEREINSKAPFSAFVFKTLADPYVGKITLMKVCSGILAPDSVVFNANKQKEEKIGPIFLMKGKHQININQVFAGDLAAVSKLQVTVTDDTLCTKDKPICYPEIGFPESVISSAVHPKTRSDEDKLGPSMAKLAEEDPTFRVSRNNETKETVIRGMGELHLDISAKRLKRKFGVSVDLSVPKVPYKETIKSSAKAEGKYKKQSGGRGQYGHVWLEVEALPRGKDFEFVNKIVGGAIPRNYIPSVEKGVRDAMSGGVIAGCPLVDLKITLYDGSFHEVDSSDMAFKIAGAMALRKGTQGASPVLLEPIVNVEVATPDNLMGDCIGDLNSKRGRILGMESVGKNKQLIRAQVPLAEIQRYAIDLRSLTQGRASFKMEFSNYEEVPPHIAEQIIAQSNKEKEEAKA